MQTAVDLRRGVYIDRDSRELAHNWFIPMFDYRVIARERLAMTLAGAAIAGGLLLTLAGPAEAQFFGWWGSAPANAVHYPQNSSSPAGPSEEPRVTPWVGHKTWTGAYRSRVRKVRPAVHKTGTTAAELARSLHPRDIARTEAGPPEPVAKVEPATAALAPALPAAPSPKPAPKPDGPGYAYGVPINPLD